MKNFEYFNETECNSRLFLRKNETKLGEKVQYIRQNEIDVNQFLKETSAQYIIFGINEFIGVKANLGKAGEKHSWEVFLNTFLNIQHNKFLKGQQIAVLGCFNYKEFETEALTLNPEVKDDLKRLREMVAEIDKDVVYLNTLIHQAGKKAIIIGGGHNNAYGNIKGLALAKESAVNVVNFDAHTDFRPLEGRHSGNGFSYAFHEDFIDTYYIFGVHENYLNKFMLKRFKEQQQRIKWFTFEELKVRFEKDFITAANNIHKAIKLKPYGIEIDVDAIENIASSAMSPSGFSVTEARQFVSLMANSTNASYLHICEGSVSMGAFPENMVGKLFTYLITDFIKAQMNANN